MLRIKEVLQMVRTKTLFFKVSEQELALFKEVARQDKLAVGTFIRRLLSLEAEKRGIALANSEEANRAGVAAN